MRVSTIKRLFTGAPFPTSMEIHERLDKEQCECSK